MPTESTEFVTAFTERRAPGALPSGTDQSNQSEKMVSSGDEYSTNAAIAEDDVSKIDKASYQKAVNAIAQDFKSLKDHAFAYTF